MEAYGMNTQEGGSMCQVLTEHAQTLGTTHRGGVIQPVMTDTTKNYGTKCHQVGTRAVPGDGECGVRVRVCGIFDLMGGKAGCHFTGGGTSPTITRGRGSVSDVHAVVLKKDE